MIIAVCQEPSPPKPFQVLYTVVVVLLFLSLSVTGTSGYKTLQAGAWNKEIANLRCAIQHPQTEPNRGKPSQTECQTEANRPPYLDITRHMPILKPSQTERQTEPIALHIWIFHGAALASIIILFKRKDAPNQPVQVSPDCILE